VGISPLSGLSPSKHPTVGYSLGYRCSAPSREWCRIAARLERRPCVGVLPPAVPPLDRLCVGFSAAPAALGPTAPAQPQPLRRRSGLPPVLPSCDAIHRYVAVISGGSASEYAYAGHVPRLRCGRHSVAVWDASGTCRAFARSRCAVLTLSRLGQFCLDHAPSLF
jgi:hypothetical protein